MVSQKSHLGNEIRAVAAGMEGVWVGVSPRRILGFRKRELKDKYVDNPLLSAPPPDLET
jgi:hypothetical protein